MYSALEFGCDTSYIYMLQDLDTDFRKRNEEILKQKRGAGYWIWKSQIILQEMEKCNRDDIVIYTDAGVEFIHNVGHLLQHIENGVMLFGSDNLHCEYCKGDVWMLEEHHKQVQATAMLFTPDEKAMELLSAWQKLNEIPGYIDDTPSEAPNHKDFKEHRHDQATLTELQGAVGIPLHWWPALYKYNGGQFVYPRSGKTESYPATFYHHRKRNDEW